MPTIPIVISSRSTGTSTTQTQLSGDRSGNAADFVVPTWCKGIPRVRTFITELTPTAGQSVLNTLKISSNDLNCGNYEVFAAPLGSVLGATATYLAGDGQNTAVYPWNLKTNGGEHLQFFGQSQITNTVAARQGACIWANDVGPVPELGSQWYHLLTSKINNSSNPTSTGTSAAAVTGQTITISGTGLVTIRSLYGVVTNGTIVASDTVIGWFTVLAPEIPVQLQWNMEPITGFLGATGQSQNLISKLEGISIQVKTPTTLSTLLTMDVAPANAGNFEHCVAYQ
jgi:hypothetical protein